MLTSQFFIPINLKESRLLSRAGFAYQDPNQPLLWLPLGMRVIKKLQAIIQQELRPFSELEIALPALTELENKTLLIKFLKKEIRSHKLLPLFFHQNNQEIYSLNDSKTSAGAAELLITEKFSRILTHLNMAQQDIATLLKWHCFDTRIQVLTSNGTAVSLWLSRLKLDLENLISKLAEIHFDQYGLVWPENLAPFQIGIIPLQFHKSYRVRQLAEQCYQQLCTAGYEVLMDDRKERPVTLFSQMDLLGIPHRLVINERNIDQGVIEYKSRHTNLVEKWPIYQILEKFNIASV